MLWIWSCSRTGLFKSFYDPAPHPLPAQDVYSHMIPLLQYYSLTEE
jgi:hypothetical protein